MTIDINLSIELIVNVSTQTGYLLKGNVEASENEVKISVTGNKNLFNTLELKEKINDNRIALD